MIQIRKSSERGHFNHGWLDTFHTFSFADYFDPKHRHFRSLRVINEDRVAPGQGFPAHSHNDMEIITYVLEGAVAHQDSMGNKTQIPAGEIQRMTAGTGVTHSEYNPSDKETLHLLQIWIFPEAKGLKPGYEQKKLGVAQKKNSLCPIASPNPSQGMIKIHQDAELYAAFLESGKSVEYSMRENRHAWLQVTRGSLELNGTALKAGDGAAVSEEKSLKITGKEGLSEFLLFDLA